MLERYKVKEMTDHSCDWIITEGVDYKDGKRIQRVIELYAVSVYKIIVC